MASKIAWGLEIGQSAIRAVKMRRQKTGPEIADYAVLPIVAGALAIAVDEDLLARLRVMEGAAVKAMAEATP